MKLYTEEQLLNTIEAIRDYLKNYPEKFHESMIEKHLKNLEPIELPSDEEIEQIALDFAKKYRATTYEISALTIGAKWMRDKIEGGNNEQRETK